jgi:hypothetical protein
LKVPAFLGILTGLLLVVVCVIRYDSRALPDTGSDLLRFQQMVGGVGLGAVIVPAWNFSDFDPRLQPEAMDTLYPLPGGYGYSPDRLAMVSAF